MIRATSILSVGFVAALLLATTLLAQPGAPRFATTNANRTRESYQLQAFEPAKIVARVGEQTILAGDLLGPVNQALEPYVGKVPEAEINKQKALLMRQLLDDLIDIKILYNEFLRGIPEDKRGVLNDRVTKVFVEERLPSLLEETKVKSPAELELKLRSYGSSLEKMKQQFAEGVIAQEKVRSEVNFEPEVTHAEMLSYYRSHPDEYKIEARARWEVLSSKFNRFGGDKAQTYKHLARMGNEVVGGASFSAVAKRASHGFKAAQGGYHDWTRQNVLASKEIDKAIFTLPLNRLSKPIEDQNGFHIVRVIERRAATTEPFIAAQTRIAEEIRKEKVAEQRKAYLAKVKRTANVWTIFDGTRSASNDQPPQR